MSEPFMLFAWPDGSPIEQCHPTLIVSAEPSDFSTAASLVTERDANGQERSFLLPIDAKKVFELKGTAAEVHQDLIAFVGLPMDSDFNLVILRLDIGSFDIWRHYGALPRDDTNRVTGKGEPKFMATLNSTEREAHRLQEERGRVFFAINRSERDRRLFEAHKAELAAKLRS